MVIPGWGLRSELMRRLNGSTSAIRECPWWEVAPQPTRQALGTVAMTNHAWPGGATRVPDSRVPLLAAKADINHESVTLLPQVVGGLQVLYTLKREVKLSEKVRRQVPSALDQFWEGKRHGLASWEEILNHILNQCRCIYGRRPQPRSTYLWEASTARMSRRP